MPDHDNGQGALPVLVTPTCDLPLRHPARETEKWELLGSLREPFVSSVVKAFKLSTTRDTKDQEGMLGTTSLGV